MIIHRIRRVAALGLPLLGVIPGLPAGAQQSQTDSAQLEEITVTAEKRETTVQTTPMSLTAISGQDIQDRGITDLGSLVLTVPGVSIRTSGPGMTEFEMRGISSTGGNSPTVGFYYDDTSLTAPSASNEGKIVISPALYDLNRVEVLRGPQGTLYGSGSMGGTIKVVPNAPNTEAFDASAEVVFGDTDHGGFDHAENAMVNLPFGAGLAAVRIVGSYSRDAGWIDRVVIAPGEFPVSNGNTRGNVLAAPVVADYHDVNDVERTNVRVSAVIKPVDGLSITPSFFYQNMQSGGLPYIDSTPGTDAHYQPFNISEAYSDVFKLSSLNITYKTPNFELTSITSYWSRNEPLTQDASESWTTGLGLTGYTPAQGGLGAASAIEYNPTHQTTEELRIASVGDSKLKWLLGYYYEDFHSAWDIVFPSQNGAALFGSNNLFSYFSPMPIYQQSVFGEVTYNITDPWAVTLGARRYRYSAPVSLDQFGALTETAVTQTSEKDQGVLPKASMSYQFTPDLLVYVTAAKGFRPGGGTGPVPTSGPLTCETQLQQEYGSAGFVNGPTSFKSDNIWSYEVGEKLRLLENRVTVNGSLYFEKWAGVQQTNALSSCGYVYTANAGDAHVRGGELEIQAIVVPELTVSGNVGYSHAALVSSTLIDAGFSPGTAIQDVPQWTSTVSAAYRHHLTEQLALLARADNTYTGSRTDETYSINQLPSYDLSNIRAGVDGGRWSAVLFINNVADKRALLNNITQAAVNLPTFNRVSVSQPRTAGIDLSYRFGGT
jgi:iron complex outermembrane receptor protein